MSNPNPVGDSRLSCSLMDRRGSRSKGGNNSFQKVNGKVELLSFSDVSSHIRFKEKRGKQGGGGDHTSPFLILSRLVALHFTPVSE